jgi:hypothetical protein
MVHLKADTTDFSQMACTSILNGKHTRPKRTVTDKNTLCARCMKLTKELTNMRETFVKEAQNIADKHGQ